MCHIYHIYSLFHVIHSNTLSISFSHDFFFSDHPLHHTTWQQVLSYVRFGLISAKTIADAVECHPLVQTKAGKSFVHEAYRFQALPPESRQEFAKSMAARARPRTAPAASRRGSAGGHGRLADRSLEAAGMDDGQGSISDDSDASEDQHKRREYRVWGCGGEDTGRNSSSSSPVVDEKQHRQQQQQQRRGSSAWESGASGVAQCAPISGSSIEKVKAVSIEQEEENSQEGKEGSRSGRGLATSRPGRRSWGAEFRMYV